MMKRTAAAALVFAAVLLCACGGNPGPEATPTPTASAPIESRIAAYADADVTEEDNQLVIGIRIGEADMDEACGRFFGQAADIYTHCVSGAEYTGVSFSLLRGGRVVCSFFVLPDEGGMQVFEPAVFDEAYEEAVFAAFYDSAFARSLQD
jgi:hypothetical protein